MKPCPHCSSTKIVPAGCPAVQMKCMTCGMRGPEAQNEKDAEILWDRRPEVDFWKQLATYLYAELELV